ncbi:MAG: hypothetical protein J5602_12325 [Clostridia bacterium]|nr:hypothetical protein [Clostridia bacterium]
MKKLIALILTLILTLSIPALAENVQAAGPVDDAAQDNLAGFIIVLHTGDTLGASGEGLSFEHVAEARARFTDEGAAVLLLDDGGILPGDAGEEQAASILQAMTAAGYDAMCPAAPEFRQGLDQLAAMKSAAGFPLLSVNALDAEGARLLSGSIIVEKDGLRIGVFGATGASEAEGLTISDAAKAAQSAVSTLRGEGCDVVVALARLGADETGAPAAVSLAQAVDGIDIVIDMSAKAPAEGLWTDSGALVVSSPAQFRGIGIVAIDPTGRCAAMVMDDSWF